MKTIFFTHFNDNDGIKTGREMLSSLIWRALKNVNGDNADIYTIRKDKKGAASAFAYGVVGWLDGLSNKNTKEFISIIRSAKCTHVFIDGSNLGRLAREVKKEVPKVEIVTFFHNVEYVFFRANFKRLLSPRSFAIMACNYIAERMAVKWSDTILCLNKREALMLNRVYGNISTRGKIRVFPMCIDENPSSGQVCLHAPSKPRVALFVGGAFYANLEGVRWYARNVAEHINCRTLIVGKGFDAYRDELERYDNIKVVGEVDDLGEWYRGASLVVSPIFDGSGMKTKTAEAIQFGRPIFGTDEAFVGYEEFIPQIGCLCNDAVMFIDSINKFLSGGIKFESSLIRNVYVEKYSLQAAQNRLKDIF